MLNTTYNLPPEVQVSVDKVLLAVHQPGLIMKLGAMDKYIETKGGNTLRSSRYDRFPTAIVPLSRDGSEPAGIPVVRTDLDATVSFYGLYAAVNQRVFLQNQDQVLHEISELCGLSMRMTEDQLMRDTLAATSTVYRATGGTNGDLPTNISLSDIDEVCAALLGNDAWYMLDRIQPGRNFSSGPTRNAYLMLSHSDMTPDFNNLNGFTPQWNYASQKDTIREEWGSVTNVRMMVSSVGSKTLYASKLGNTVYNNFITGMESYGCVHQDNYSSAIIFRPAIFSGALAQNVTIGYTMAEVNRIYDDQWLTNQQCTLS